MEKQMLEESIQNFIEETKKKEHLLNLENQIAVCNIGLDYLYYLYFTDTRIHDVEKFLQKNNINLDFLNKPNWNENILNELKNIHQIRKNISDEYIALKVDYFKPAQDAIFYS